MTVHRYPRRVSVAIAIVTVSDTRTERDDVNGAWLNDRISAAGHRLVCREIVPDGESAVSGAIERARAAGARVIVTNGGTGVAPRDRTYEAVSAMIERPVPGFGELFRMISYQEIGSAAMLSRAIAGVVGDTMLFCVPGSPAAVRLAWERLIEPEIAHVDALLDP